MSTLSLYVTTVTVLDLRHGKYYVEYLLVIMIIVDYLVICGKSKGK